MKETGTRKLFVWPAKHLVFEQNCFADSSQDVTQNTESRKQHQNQYVDDDFLHIYIDNHWRKKYWKSLTANHDNTDEKWWKGIFFPQIPAKLHFCFWFSEPFEFSTLFAVQGWQIYSLQM